MSLSLLGLGTAAPNHEITQIHAAEAAAALCCDSADHQRVLQAVYRRSGVKTRRSVLLESSSNSVPAKQSFYGSYLENRWGPTTSERMLRYESDAGPLAVRAAALALEQSGLRSLEITHLVTVSCTGFSAPGFDVALIEQIGLPPTVARTHVGFMGCHGSLNGLRVARAYVEADPKAKVLLTSVELCSLHHQYGWAQDTIVANALFSDGAAAVVGGQTSELSTWRLIANGSCIVPETSDLMAWHIRDHGFEMGLSARVPQVIAEHLRPWLTSWLAKLDLKVETVGSWAIHPGGPRILDACLEALRLDSRLVADSQRILAEHGNMSSATVLFILQSLMSRNAPRPCVALAFGPGLTIEAALFE